MSDEDFVYYESSDEENKQICVTIRPKNTAACKEQVIEHQSPCTELLLKQPTDQAILKSIQESCGKQELFQNKVLEELISLRAHINNLVLMATATQQARVEEATQATISTNQRKLDEATAETTSATREIKTKELLWIRYTLYIEQGGKFVNYPILLCLGQCKGFPPHDCDYSYLSDMAYRFVTTETTVMLVLRPSRQICMTLKETHGMTFKFFKYHDLTKQGLKYWQLIGDKELEYVRNYVTSVEEHL